MNLAILTVLLQIDMPDPPTPGGPDLTEWWRIIGLIAVTILTTGILALIFKPAVPAKPPEEKTADPPLLTLVPPGGGTLLRRAGDPQGGSLIPFPSRNAVPTEPVSDFTVAAASERLRRITRQSTEISGVRNIERRRLGSRRGERSLDGSPHEAPGDDLASLLAPLSSTLRPPQNLGTSADVKAPEPSEPERVEQDAHIPSNTESGDEPDGSTNNLMADSGREGEEDDLMNGSPDSWELLGELTMRLPSEADRLAKGPPTGFTPDDLDLLGDIVNWSPSVMDKIVEEPRTVPSPIKGDVPSAAEVDRMIATPPPGNVVQFVPRQTPPPSDEIDPAYELLNQVSSDVPPVDKVLTQFPVDLTTREDVTATVQELLFCANVGEFIHGFALYTDKFLFKFMDMSGLNEDDFRERFSNVPPKDPADWTRIDSIREFRRLDDGRIAAMVQYIDGGVLDGTERYVFKQDSTTTRWLIDDITAVT